MDNNENKLLDHNTKAVVINNMSNKTDGMPITSLVLGIMSCILFFSIIYCIISALIGFILGLISLIQRRDKYKLAIAGIILSIIGSVIGIVFFVICILFIV